jgi:hypothetical protein
MRKLLMLILLFQAAFLLTIQAQDKTIQKEKWHWGEALKQDTSAGYVQVVSCGERCNTRRNYPGVPGTGKIAEKLWRYFSERGERKFVHY